MNKHMSIFRPLVFQAGTWNWIFRLWVAFVALKTAWCRWVC